MKRRTRLSRVQLYSFVKKNMANLYVNITSRFDGMVDGAVSCDAGFQKVVTPGEWSDRTMGIGVCCVGRGRDYIEPFENAVFTGFCVSNCCETFYVVIPKEAAVEVKGPKKIVKATWIQVVDLSSAEEVARAEPELKDLTAAPAPTVKEQVFREFEQLIVERRKAIADAALNETQWEPDFDEAFVNDNEDFGDDGNAPRTNERNL